MSLCLDCRTQAEPAQPQAEESVPPAPPAPVDEPERVEQVVAPVALRPPRDFPGTPRAELLQIWKQVAMVRGSVGRDGRAHRRHRGAGRRNRAAPAAEESPASAAEVPPDDEETAAAVDPAGIPGPKNGFDFEKMFQLFVMWAMHYKAPGNKKGLSRRNKLKQSAEAQVFLNTAMNYYLFQCFYQPGESVVGADDFYGTGKAGFLHGLALINLLPTFPTLCRPIANTITTTYGKYFLSNGATWVYLAGYMDMDVFTESKYGDNIYAPIPTVLDEEVREIFVGLQLFTVLKNIQFRSIMMLGSVIGMGALIGAKDQGEKQSITTGIHESQTAKMAKVALGNLLSFLNRVHGNATSAVEFTRRLWSIAKFGTILLILYIASLFGADGSVGITGKKGLGSCFLLQSNKPFLEAVAHALNTLLGFKGNMCLRVHQYTRNGALVSPRQHAPYYIKVNYAQFYPVMFTAGLLDYNRAPQWILTLALRRVVEDKTLDKEKKEKVIAFLKDMLVWIKIVRPS
ncbi:hypothetical protein THAOC_04494 [Thalassiosira oceanica]|uniref:Uncharacterized protein n=1 Tax=Thalassiosira oceanica TaxID=159749 RepID=K0TNV2_THAOC|nr:hypothetical protein THAOC_04494 [Thalassiosira oceanica]|eukprot:EJK73862.1 hypothetical protein THAOC_04494 [Thalassiosira oceanica]